MIPYLAFIFAAVLTIGFALTVGYCIDERGKDWLLAPGESWRLFRLERAKRREELRKEIEDFR